MTSTEATIPVAGALRTRWTSSRSGIGGGLHRDSLKYRGEARLLDEPVLPDLIVFALRDRLARDQPLGSFELLLCAVVRGPPLDPRACSLQRRAEDQDGVTGEDLFPRYGHIAVVIHPEIPFDGRYYFGVPGLAGYHFRHGRQGSPHPDPVDLLDEELGVPLLFLQECDRLGLSAVFVRVLLDLPGMAPVLGVHVIVDASIYGCMGMVMSLMAGIRLEGGDSLVGGLFLGRESRHGPRLEDRASVAVV